MNKKKILKLLPVVVIISIVALAGYIVYDRVYYPKISIKVCEKYYSQDYVFAADGIIFEAHDGEVVESGSNKKICDASCAKEYNDRIWAYYDSVLSCVDTSGNTKKTYTLEGSVDNFMIADLTLLTISSKGINAYEMSSTLSEIPIEYTSLIKTEDYSVFSFIYNDIMCVKIDTGSNAEKSTYYAVDLNGGEKICKNGNYQVLNADKDRIIFTCINNDENVILSLENNSGKVKTVEYEDFNSFENALYFSSDDKIYWIGQENTSRWFAKDSSLSAGDEMKNHKHDVLLTIDKNDPDIIDRWETRTFERILYADDKTIKTYYKGKYITYRTDTKEVLNENETDVIKEPGSYITQSCGDYVFIFDSQGTLHEKKAIG